MKPIHSTLPPCRALNVALAVASAVSSSRFFVLIVAIIWSCLSNIASGQVTPSGNRLRDLAPPDFAVGGVLHGYDSSFDFQPYRNTAAAEFNAITASFFMPYGPWNSGNGAINTSGFVRVVDWAQARGMRVHGHVMIYPTENVACQWLQALPNDQVEGKLRQFVTTMGRAAAGRVWVWDVVNEVIGDNGNPMDGDGVRTGLYRDGAYKPYKEYQAMGQDYIAKAFRWAREADPNAILIINEYAAEEVNDKSNRLLAFCKKLKSQGVPIDGVGFQHHWIDTRGIPDFQSMRTNMQRFADEGFKIFITETDVAGCISTDPYRRTPTGPELERQKFIYKSIMGVGLQQPMCKGFFMWDFVDDQSWMQGTDRPLLWDTIPPGAYMFGTIFWGGDSGGQNPIVAKNAYYGLQEALSNLPSNQYRFTSGWQWQTSYPTRNGGYNNNGTWSPQSTIRLERITSATSKWQSMKWTLERVTPGVYRIRCVWGAQSGYLTRKAYQASNGSWLPSDQVELTNLNPSYLSQMWSLIPQSDGSHLVHAAWQPSDGYLTREAGSSSNGGYNPGDTLRLHRNATWSSQKWYFDRN
jgi:GH35 family endo-1,4-beta-xylanase